MPIRIFTSKKNSGLDSLDHIYEMLRDDLLHQVHENRTAFHLKRLNNTIRLIINGTYPLIEKIKD